MAFFDPARRGYAEDPYPSLERLRREEPVHWSTALGAWVVVRQADCAAVLQDTERFSADPEREGAELGRRVAAHRRAMPFGGAAILGHADGAEHARLRAVVNRAFSARAVAARREMAAGLVRELLEGVRPGAPLEVMEGLARPLAVLTALAQFGVPREQGPAYFAAANAVMRARVDGLDAPGAAEEAVAAGRFLLGLLADADGDTLLGTIGQAVDGGEVTPEEAVMLAVHIALAGNIPTAMALGTALEALARFPEAREAVLQHPLLAGEAVEEALRWDSPTHAVPRFAVSETELGGRRIRAGQQVLVMVGAANRDPERFEAPGEFRLERPERRHLSFGVGSHFCLGAPLARAELSEAVREVLARFGRYRVAEAVRGGSFLVRGFARLVVVPEGAEIEG
ncbi:cytochrome P450 [Tepidiforma sp.]|uniref:cytochrome P450 n=1 Tax=Tepidiforma sp. TaxID=2682230 RepID=UPI002ADDB46A|nr:cytochrome P450 [Tepidiforma sp.]